MTGMIQENADAPRRQGLWAVAAALLLAGLTLAHGGALAQEAGSAPAGRDLESAVFAGGCFWCVEADFDKVPGVVETISGYSGGSVSDPSYEQVTAGGTGHREVVKVVYDPDRVSYGQLADYFFRTVDPTDAGGQFCDRGESYTTALYATPEQADQAATARTRAEQALGRTLVTPVLPAAPFYPAEEYHQDYYEKNALTYRYYRWRCGRDDRVESLWGATAHRLPAGGE